MRLSHLATQALQSQLRGSAASSAFLAASSRNYKLLSSHIRREDVSAGASDYIQEAKQQPLSAYGPQNERFRLKFSEETDFKLLTVAQPTPKLNYAALVSEKRLQAAHYRYRQQIALDFGAAGLSVRLSQPTLIDLYHDVLSEKQTQFIPPAGQLCFPEQISPVLDDSDSEAESFCATQDCRYLTQTHCAKSCCTSKEVSEVLSSIFADVKAVYCGALRLENDLYTTQSLLFQRNDRLFRELYPECAETAASRTESEEQHAFVDVNYVIAQAGAEEAAYPIFLVQAANARILQRRAGGDDWRDFTGQIDYFSQKHTPK